MTMPSFSSLNALISGIAGILLAVLIAATAGVLFRLWLGRP